MLSEVMRDRDPPWPEGQGRNPASAVHDLTLVTGNLAHFKRIPGLNVATWRSL
jgi:hypothetical protein